MSYALEERARRLRPELRRVYEALGAHAQEIGAAGPTLGIRNGDELGAIYKRGNRIVLRMDPKPFVKDGWLCIRIGLPMDRVYAGLDRFGNQHLIRIRPGFETQRTWFDVLDWDDDLVAHMKKLIGIAYKESHLK